MGALCSGTAQNPASIDRPSLDGMKLSKGQKTVSFSEPLTVVAPERLSPTKLAKASPEKKHKDSSSDDEDTADKVKPAAPASGHGNSTDEEQFTQASTKVHEDVVTATV